MGTGNRSSAVNAGLLSESIYTDEKESSGNHIVGVHCNKCGLDFDVDIGDKTREEVETNKTGIKCPGHHVELMPKPDDFTIDWSSIKNGSALTDDEWLKEMKYYYSEVYEKDELEKANIEITGFVIGEPMAKDTRTGEDIVLSFATAPSGKRYYYLLRERGGTGNRPSAVSSSAVFTGYRQHGAYNEVYDIDAYLKGRRKTQYVILASELLKEKEFTCPQCNKRVMPDDPNRTDMVPMGKGRWGIACMHYNCAWQSILNKMYNIYETKQEA
jgi:transcription elongation factor Elf1